MNAKMKKRTILACGITALAVALLGVAAYNYYKNPADQNDDSDTSLHDSAYANAVELTEDNADELLEEYGLDDMDYVDQLDWSVNWYIFTDENGYHYVAQRPYYYTEDLADYDSVKTASSLIDRSLSTETSMGSIILSYSDMAGDSFKYINSTIDFANGIDGTTDDSETRQVGTGTSVNFSDVLDPSIFCYDGCNNGTEYVKRILSNIGVSLDDLRDATLDEDSYKYNGAWNYVINDSQLDCTTAFRDEYGLPQDTPVDVIISFNADKAMTGGGSDIDLSDTDTSVMIESVVIQTSVGNNDGTYTTYSRTYGFRPSSAYINGETAVDTNVNDMVEMKCEDADGDGLCDTCGMSMADM